MAQTTFPILHVRLPFLTEFTSPLTLEVFSLCSLPHSQQLVLYESKSFMTEPWAEVVENGKRRLVNPQDVLSEVLSRVCHDERDDTIQQPAIESAIAALLEIKLSSCMRYLLWQDRFIRLTYTERILGWRGKVCLLFKELGSIKTSHSSRMYIITSREQCIALVSECLEYLSAKLPLTGNLSIALQVKVAAYLSVLFSLPAGEDLYSVYIKHRVLEAYCRVPFIKWSSSSFLQGFSKAIGIEPSFWDRLTGVYADIHTHIKESKSAPEWQTKAFILASVFALGGFVLSGKSVLGNLADDDEEDYE